MDQANLRSRGANHIAAVVFDFDGLLMDTESTLLQSWQFEWRQWGLDLDVSSFFPDHGADVTEDRFSTLARAVGDAFDREVSRERQYVYRLSLQESLDLSEGIMNWLSEASALGLRLAVASSAPLEWVAGNLERVGALDHFEVLAGGDEVDNHKPAPDVYELALSRLGTSRGRTVAVEDTAHGVDAAHAAGLRCIAIPNRFVTPDRVGHAELVLRSANDLTLRQALDALLAEA